MSQTGSWLGLRFCLASSVFAFLAACAQAPVVQPLPSAVPEAFVVGQWGGRFAVKVDRVSVAETQSTQQDSGGLFILQMEVFRSGMGFL